MRSILIPAQLAVGIALAALAASSTGASADQIHPSSQVTHAINQAIKNSGVQIAPGDPLQGSGKQGGKSDNNGGKK